MGARPRRPAPRAGTSVHRSPANRGPNLDVREQPSAAPAAHPAAATPEFPRHVVTAVLVAHDGARWLPKALAGLLAQDRPVQDVIAADTGSADDSARLLAESLGDRARPAPRPPHRLRRRPSTRPPAPPARSPPTTCPTSAPQRLGPRHPQLERRRLRPAGAARTANPSSGCGCCTTTASPIPAPSPPCCASRRRDSPTGRRHRPQAAQLVRPQAAARSRRQHRPQRPPLDRPGAPRTGPGPARPGPPGPRPSPPPACWSAATSGRNSAASTAGCP